MKIYKMDYSKLIKRGKAGYRMGQEQAKEYFDYVPVGRFTVEIKNKQYIKDVLQMINMDDKDNKIILVSVDNEDAEHVAVTVIFSVCKVVTHTTVSYKYCEDESDYELANRILAYVRDKIGG